MTYYDRVKKNATPHYRKAHKHLGKARNSIAMANNAIKAGNAAGGLTGTEAKNAKDKLSWLADEIPEMMDAVKAKITDIKSGKGKKYPSSTGR